MCNLWNKSWQIKKKLLEVYLIVKKFRGFDWFEKKYLVVSVPVGNQLTRLRRWLRCKWRLLRRRHWGAVGLATCSGWDSRRRLLSGEAQLHHGEEGVGEGALLWCRPRQEICHLWIRRSYLGTETHPPHRLPRDSGSSRLLQLPPLICSLIIKTALISWLTGSGNYKLLEVIINTSKNKSYRNEKLLE